MWETLLGGVIALAGAVIAQYVQSRREYDRWRRQASYDERRKAYVAFIEEYGSFQNATSRWETSSSEPIPPSVYADDHTVLDPLYDLLTPIRVYGTKRALQYARAAIPAMWQYMQSDGHHEKYAVVDEAIGRFIDEVRADLAIHDIGREEPDLPTR